MKNLYNNSCLPERKGRAPKQIRFAFLSFLLMIASIALPAKSANAAAVGIISINPSGNVITNSKQVSYSALSSAAVTGVNANNFSITTSSGLSSGLINSLQAAGLFQDIGDNIQFLPNSSATTTPPLQDVVVTSFKPTGQVVTNATSMAYNIVFNGPVTGLSPSNFSLTTTGNVAGASVTSVTGSDSTYTVTIAAGTGDGTINLNLANGNGLSKKINQTLPVVSEPPYRIDRTPPQYTSLSMTSNGPGDHSKVAIGNMVRVILISNEQLGTITLTINGHPITVNQAIVQGYEYYGNYTMTASDPPGLVHYSITFSDLAGNQVGPYNDVNDDVTFSPAAAITSIKALTTPFQDVTNAKTQSWQIIFSQPITGLSTSNFALAHNGTAAGTLSGVTQVSSSVYNITASDVSGDGLLALNFVNDTNLSATITSVIPYPGPNYIIDNTPPKAVFGPPSANITTNAPVSYQLIYTDLHLYQTNVAAGDITLNKTGTANGDIVISGGATGSDTSQSYTVSVTNITGSGTLGVTVAAGKATDDPGNLATGAVSTNFTVLPDTASLSNLQVGGGTFSSTPSFDPAVTTYSASIPNSTLSTTITPFTKYGNETVTINGHAATSGQPYTVSNLLGGDNNYVIKVTGGDATSITYNLDIIRTKAPVATLKNLTVDNGVTFLPAFSPSQLTYSATVPNATTLVNITPTLTDSIATIKVGGTTEANATPIPFSLNVGANTFTATVTSQNGLVQSTYSITITRSSSTPSANTGLSGLQISPGSVLTQTSSSPTEIDYTTSVSSATTSVMIKPTASDPAAAITVNGQPLANGYWSPAITLNTDGTPTAVTTVVTAQNGTQKSYVISISKNGSSNIVLEGLQLNPNASFITVSNTTTQTNYTASVSATTNSVEIKPTLSDPTGTITVNGEAVTSGSWSQAITLNTDSTPTVVTTVVTSGNGSQKSYVVSVSKNGSSDVVLEGLQLNPNSVLTETSSTATQINYNTSVSLSTASVEVKPTASDPTASITVNGQAVTSGDFSQSITLITAGPTVVTTVVTAANGTQKSYVINITKNGSSGVVLETLFMDPVGPRTETSSTSTQVNYSAALLIQSNNIEMHVGASDTTSSITINGANYVDHSYVNVDVNPDGSPTVVTIVITSENGSQMTYVITVTDPFGAAMAAILPQQPFRLQLVTDVVVHQAVTPDGDGINDYLKIDGIEQYPANKLVVLNSSGAKVYEAAGYDNVTKTFDGHASTSRSLLQPGTYYYMLDYKKDNTTQHKTGYFVLKY